MDNRCGLRTVERRAAKLIVSIFYITHSPCAAGVGLNPRSGDEEFRGCVVRQSESGAHARAVSFDGGNFGFGGGRTDGRKRCVVRSSSSLRSSFVSSSEHAKKAAAAKEER